MGPLVRVKTGPTHEGGAGLTSFWKAGKDIGWPPLVQPAETAPGATLTSFPISGKGPEQLHKAGQAGAMAVLRKPIDPVQVMTEVDRVLAM